MGGAGDEEGDESVSVRAMLSVVAHLQYGSGETRKIYKTSDYARPVRHLMKQDVEDI